MIDGDSPGAVRFISHVGKTRSRRHRPHVAVLAVGPGKWTVYTGTTAAPQRLFYYERHRRDQRRSPFVTYEPLQLPASTCPCFVSRVKETDIKSTAT